jgi:hypothetical protein
MKKLFVLALLVTLPLLAVAQNAFEGTWKVSTNNADFGQKPDMFLLQNGMYSCKSCTPPYEVKADGKQQPVTGHPYFDSVAIKVVNPHTIEETDMKNGKVVATSKTTVSKDGKMAMFEFSDSSNTNAAPVTGKGESTRVEAGPPGSHPVSGSWHLTKIENISDNGVTFTYKMSGDEMMMTTPTGQSYSAKLDGTEAPYKGDPGTTTVSLKKIDDNTMEETDMRDGKVISVSKMMIGPDGKTMKIMVDDKLRGNSTQFEAMKQ